MVLKILNRWHTQIHLSSKLSSEEQGAYKILIINIIDVCQEMLGKLLIEG